MNFFKLLCILIISAVFAHGASAGVPTKNDQGIYEIYLDQFDGYFAAKDTLASLKPGKYQFIVTNKTKKTVGFQLQNFKSHDQLDMFPLEPGEIKKSSVVEISEDGFRFRCPINPTPWYDLDTITKK